MCDDTQADGIVLLNTATVTSEGTSRDDDACQVVQLDDVEIVKTTVRPRTTRSSPTTRSDTSSP